MIKTVLKLFLPLALAGGLGGCGEEVSCSSDAAKELVLSIAKKKYASYMDIDASRFALNTIRTESRNATGAFCEADLNYTYQLTGEVAKNDFAAIVVRTQYGATGQPQTRPLTYKIQTTDDSQLYASVLGLEK